MILVKKDLHLAFRNGLKFCTKVLYNALLKAVDISMETINKQKMKIGKNCICVNLVWCEKTNSNASNHGIWEYGLYKNKNILYVRSRVNPKNISNNTFCITVVS